MREHTTSELLLMATKSDLKTCATIIAVCLFSGSIALCSVLFDGGSKWLLIFVGAFLQQLTLEVRRLPRLLRDYRQEKRWVDQ